jgi:hypothetical protein
MQVTAIKIMINSTKSNIFLYLNKQVKHFKLIVLAVSFLTISIPVHAQGTSRAYICGAETGKVYLRSEPNSSSMNSKRILVNGTSVKTGKYRKGFIFVTTNNGMNGWITEKYICQSSPPHSNQKTSFVCGAETGRVYLRPQPNSASMNSKQTLANETPVQIHEYKNGYVLVETLNGMTGWVTEQYICP